MRAFEHTITPSPHCRTPCTSATCMLCTACLDQCLHLCHARILSLTRRGANGVARTVLRQWQTFWTNLGQIWAREGARSTAGRAGASLHTASAPRRRERLHVSRAGTPHSTCQVPIPRCAREAFHKTCKPRQNSILNHWRSKRDTGPGGGDEGRLRRGVSCVCAHAPCPSTWYTFMQETLLQNSLNKLTHAMNHQTRAHEWAPGMPVNMCLLATRSCTRQLV